MSILCLWEMTTRDSPAEVVSALFYFIAMTVALVWAAFKVTRLAKRSVAMHKNPAYILYSDPTALNKWGFLYVQFRATAYYFILPVLCHLLLKAIFIAFSQDNPVAQAIGLVIIEALWLIGVSILRPWMDKKTNAFNIAIAAMNFFNAILLLFFTDVFNQPVGRPDDGSLCEANVPLGPGNWHLGRRVCSVQRDFCRCPAHHGLDRVDICHRVEGSRHAVSAHARRPRIVHQVCHQPDHRAGCPRRHRPGRHEDEA